MCVKMRGHEPTADIEGHPTPSLPCLGVQGAFSTKGPRLDWSEMTEAELDQYAEVMYNRQMAVYEAIVAVQRRPRRRRGFHDYTAKNCEEARGESFQS